jgi:methylenetetrahydrofolate reductase (NADPH)
VAFISSRFNFCLGTAGYPEGHIDAKSQAKDIEILKLKVDNGAEFIITNYFYDNRYFFDFVDRCLAAGITIPILPGIMPVYSVKMMEMLAGLCGATITKELRQGLAALPKDDKTALNEFGIEFATAQCRELLNAGVVGLHIYTMDRSSSTVGIVNRLRAESFL